MPKMEFDFQGLIQLLAKNLYSEKRVFIRELIQNAHDGILRRQSREPDAFSPRIDVESRPDELQFIIRDNGLGMDLNDIREYLAVIGRGATRLEKGDVTGLVGQFGIGFLSAFIVAERVEVETRKVGDDDGWKWSNSGTEDYTVTKVSKDSFGTTVTVFLNGEADKGVIHPEEVDNVIRKYADMLKVPIHLNGSREPINQMMMPWERDELNGEARTRETQAYLAKTMPDSPLAIIDVDIADPGPTQGVLYISDQRSLPHHEQPPGRVRLYLQRMFLCETTDLLPPWARFVRGVINTSAITPTAARDNFVRDEITDRIKEEFGHYIIERLRELSLDEPQRFQRILKYHDLGIKAACYEYDELFRNVANLLEWRTNCGGKSSEEESYSGYYWRRLPEILSALPKSESGPQALPCFSTALSANQYFNMAESANSLVIDASGPFEMLLLEQYAKFENVSIKIIRVDQIDDPNIFRHLEEHQEEVRFQRLATRMEQVVKPRGRSIRVEARKFKPADLAALIRTTERSEMHHQAEDLLNQPNTPQSMREMAETLLKMTTAESMRLTINADNSLIRDIAEHPELFGEPEVDEILSGIYNNAILFNQDLLTTENTQILNQQMHRLLVKHWETLADGAEAEIFEPELNQPRADVVPAKNPERQHRCIFMVMPEAAEFDDIIDAVRTVVEDRWKCELLLARDLKQKSTDGIRRLMNRADAFIVESTTSQPQVMLETGAVRFDPRSRPFVLLRDAAHELREEMSFDPGNQNCIDYRERGDKALVDYLDHKMQNDVHIAKLLKDSARQRFLSPRRLVELFKPVTLDALMVRTLVSRFPTEERWRKVTAEDLADCLDEHKGFASILLDNVHKSLN